MTTNYETRSNSEVNEPINLYRIGLAELGEAADLFLCNADQNVDYYRKDGETLSAQTYLAASIQHEGIDTKTNLQIPQVRFSLGDADRSIQFYVEKYNGLRGVKITNWRVFAEHLDDDTAYREDVFYIQSVVSRGTVAVFTATGRMTGLLSRLPAQTYKRGVCRHTYKGCRCWIADGMGGFTMPTDFTTEERNIFTAQERADTGNPAVIQIWVGPRDMGDVDKTAHQIRFDMKCDNPGAMTNTESYIKLDDTDDYSGGAFIYNDLTTLGITTDWQTFTLDLADFSDLSPALDFHNVRLITVNQTASTDITMEIRNIRLYSPDYDACDQNLVACENHANVPRYGAQEGIPNTPVIFA